MAFRDHSQKASGKNFPEGLFVVQTSHFDRFLYSGFSS